MAKKLSTGSLLLVTILLGVICGAFLVQQTISPIRSSELFPPGQSRHGNTGPAEQGRPMVASRQAIDAMNEKYSVRSVMKKLFSSPPASYKFRREFFKEGGKLPVSRHCQMLPLKILQQMPSLNETTSAESENRTSDDLDLEGMAMWSAEPYKEEEGDIEIQDIVFYDLPLFCLSRPVYGVGDGISLSIPRCGRSVDRKRGDKPRRKVRSAAAACSSSSLTSFKLMIFRPYASWFAVIGLWLVVKNAVDVFGKVRLRRASGGGVLRRCCSATGTGTAGWTSIATCASSPPRWRSAR
eukprot:747448-Hanusia_phi.AAC.7